MVLYVSTTLFQHHGDAGNECRASEKGPDSLAQCHRIRMEGRFDAAGMRRFAESRAALLDLAIDTLDVSPTRFDSRLSGEEVLLGMFGMACLVGPSDCVVTRFESLPA